VIDVLAEKREELRGLWKGSAGAVDLHGDFSWIGQRLFDATDTRGVDSIGVFRGQDALVWRFAFAPPWHVQVVASTVQVAVWVGVVAFIVFVVVLWAVELRDFVLFGHEVFDGFVV